jgi:hypothetical protein
MRKAIKNNPIPNQITTDLALAEAASARFDFALPIVISTAASIMVVGCSTYLNRNRSITHQRAHIRKHIEIKANQHNQSYGDLKVR